MNADARVDPTVVETRRLELLRLIANSGGKISPVSDTEAKHGYRYARVETSRTTWRFSLGKTISKPDFLTG